MAAWKTYSWEKDRWAAFQRQQLTHQEAKKLLQSLARHFKTPQVLVTFKRGGSTWGDYVGWQTLPRFWQGVTVTGRIRLCDMPSLGMVLHEYAHHLNRERWQQRGHGKTFKRELKRVYTFGKRYLKEQL